MATLLSVLLPTVRATALALSVGLALACGGGPAASPAPPNPAGARLGPSGKPSACFAPGEGLPTEWPAVLVPDGADVCRSSRKSLELAMFDDADPPLRARMTALLASTPEIKDTGRRHGTRTIYRVGDLEFVVLGYVGEDSDHAGMQTQVQLQRCGEPLGGGDITCKD